MPIFMPSRSIKSKNCSVDKKSRYSPPCSPRISMPHFLKIKVLQSIRWYLSKLVHYFALIILLKVLNQSLVYTNLAQFHLGSQGFQQIYMNILSYFNRFVIYCLFYYNNFSCLNFDYFLQKKIYNIVDCLQRF